ncbi:hypothetical protein D3C87_1765860 [compost metagenome]
MQDVLHIHVTAVFRKNVTIGIVKHAEHAGELLDKVAVLIERPLGPFSGTINKVHIKAGEVGQIVLHWLIAFLMPALFQRFAV